MICKIQRGQDPRRLMQYLFRPSCFSKVFDVNPVSHKEYAKTFSEHNNLRPEIKRPMYHLSVRLEKGINPTDEEISDLSRELIEGMGLGFNRPIVIVKHENERGDPGVHFHIATSRIDYSGNVWYGRNDAKQAIALCREIGKPSRFENVDPGFAPRVWSTGPGIQPKQTHREAKMLERTGAWSHKEHVALSLSQVLRTIPRKGQEPLCKEFVEGCAIYGITPKLYTRTNGKQGLIYEFKGATIPASRIGRDYTLKGLSRHFHSQAKSPDEPVLETPLPKARKSSLRKFIDESFDHDRPRYRQEMQEQDTADIYEMVRELKHCEFDDLKLIGESLHMQFHYKIVSKDTMSYLNTYVRLIYGELQTKRTISINLKKGKSTLVILKPEDTPGTDEHFEKHIAPTFSKIVDPDKAARMERLHSSISMLDKLNYNGHVFTKNRLLDLKRFEKTAEDHRRNSETLHREIENHDSKGFVERIFSKKPTADTSPAPQPPLADDEKYLSDTEFGEERRRWTTRLFNSIAKERKKRGLPVSHEDVRAIELPRNQPAPELTPLTPAIEPATTTALPISIEETATAPAKPVPAPIPSTVIAKPKRVRKAPSRGGPDR
jgi:hypothetical protein